jgi:hypothetical protein
VSLVGGDPEFLADFENMALIASQTTRRGPSEASALRRISAISASRIAFGLFAARLCLSAGKT